MHSNTVDRARREQARAARDPNTPANLQRRQVEALERIARHLEKLANLAEDVKP